MIKNYGLNISKERAEQSEKDWIYGAGVLSDLVKIPEEEREKYLPDGEVQVGIEDMMDCATRAPLNILEMKFTYLIRNDKLSAENIEWLYNNGYITFN